MSLRDALDASWRERAGRLFGDPSATSAEPPAVEVPWTRVPSSELPHASPRRVAGLAAGHGWDVRSFVARGPVSTRDGWRIADHAAVRGARGDERFTALYWGKPDGGVAFGGAWCSDVGRVGSRELAAWLERPHEDGNEQLELC